MEGIQILSQEVIYSAGSKPVLPALLAMAIVTIFCFIVAVKELDASIAVLGTVCAMLVGFIVGFIIETITKSPTDRYEYKVLIDDSVSATEFYEKYDLISVEGQIFTIRDKEIKE